MLRGAGRTAPLPVVPLPDISLWNMSVIFDTITASVSTQTDVLAEHSASINQNNTQTIDFRFLTVSSYWKKIKDKNINVHMSVCIPSTALQCLGVGSISQRAAFIRDQRLANQSKVWWRGRAWEGAWADGRRWLGIRFRQPPSWRWVRHLRPWWRSSFLWIRFPLRRLCRPPASAIRFLPLWCRFHSRICFKPESSQ